MTTLTMFINDMLRVAAVLPGLLGALATIQGFILCAIAHATHDACGHARAVRYATIGVCLLTLCAVLRAPALATWLTEVILG